MVTSQPIHQERGASHVTGVFEKTDKQEEQEDLRQEDDDRAHARDHTVHEQTVQVAWRD